MLDEIPTGLSAAAPCVAGNTLRSTALHVRGSGWSPSSVILHTQTPGSPVQKICFWYGTLNN